MLQINNNINNLVNSTLYGEVESLKDVVSKSTEYKAFDRAYDNVLEGLFDVHCNRIWQIILNKDRNISLEGSLFNNINAQTIT